MGLRNWGSPAMGQGVNETGGIVGKRDLLWASPLTVDRAQPRRASRQSVVLGEERSLVRRPVGVVIAVEDFRWAKSCKHGLVCWGVGGEKWKMSVSVYCSNE